MINFRSTLSPERREFLTQLVESRKKISPGTPVELTDFLKIDEKIRQAINEYIDVLEDKIARSLYDDFPAPSDPAGKFLFGFRDRIDTRQIAEELASEREYPVSYIAYSIEPTQKRLRNGNRIVHILITNF